MGQIRTVCQTEAAHVEVPGNYENAEELLALKKRIVGSERLSVVDLENLVSHLEQLCSVLKERCSSAGKEYREANRLYLEKRDACTAGIQLLKRFQDLEQAEQELAECRAREQEMKETAALIRRINDAYEIRAVYDRYMDAKQTVEKTQYSLKKQQEALPGLDRSCEETKKQTETANELLHKEIQNYTKVSERVTRALEVLRRIREAEEKTASAAAAARQAEKDAAEIRQKISRLEENEQKWRSQAGGTGTGRTASGTLEERSG